MKTVLVFGGTVEGRALSAVLSGLPVRCVVCVATEYGEARLEPHENVTVLRERMDAPRMDAVIQEFQADLVVDATHPYAGEASANLRAACAARGVELLRLVRESSLENEGFERCGDTAGLVDRLNQLPGNVLLTTGSKDLAAFTTVLGYRDRIYLRILPYAPSLAACAALGFDPAKVICAQGPFSQAFNEALLREFDIRVLVTKDSGRAGGFPEKLAAAKNLGVRVLVLGRPPEEEGFPLEQIVQLLNGRYGAGGGEHG